MKVKRSKCDKGTGLVPGAVHHRHFELLVAGTGIKSKALLQALRNHLVLGMSGVAARAELAVNVSLFSRRLAILRAEHQRCREISQFYVLDRSHASPVHHGAATDV